MPKTIKNKFGKIVNDRLVEFTVYRGNWQRGKGHGLLLHRDTRKRCCIGFMSAACGVSDADMMGRGTIRALPNPDQVVEGASIETHGEEDPLDDAYALNDDIFLARREKAIATWFKENYAITVRFVDGKEPE